MIKYLKHPIHWTGAKDDQTGRYENYVLRAEQLDKHIYWWCVYFKGNIIAASQKSSMFSAKKEAVKEVILHIRDSNAVNVNKGK